MAGTFTSIFNNVPKIYLDPANAFPAVAGTGGVTGMKLVMAGAGSVGNRPVLIANTAAGAAVVGVADKDAVAGASVGLLSRGCVEVRVGAAALTEGLPVMADATGAVVLWTTGNHKVGTTFGAAAANATIPVKLSNL